MMKTKYLYTASLCLMMMFGSCSDFLDQEPDTILTQDQTYGDEALMKSVLANFYGRVMFGQKIEDSDAWRLLDEVITYDRSQEGAWGRTFKPSQTFKRRTEWIGPVPGCMRTDVP